jgi:hypothetical protein
LESSDGKIDIYYQPHRLGVYKNSKTHFIDEDDEQMYIIGDNIIEQHFSCDCNFRSVINSGIQSRYFHFHREILDRRKKMNIIFNDLNADDIFKQYGFKKSVITKKAILNLFNKMNDLGDVSYVSRNTELDTELHSELKDLVLDFYKKQKEINKQQQELYFIAKNYYLKKYSIFKKGNFYLNIDRWGGMEVYYQPSNFELYRFSNTFYEERKEDEQYRYRRFGNVYKNVIENNFRFNNILNYVITKGISDRYERSVQYLDKTYVLFNDSNAEDVFKKYGFKKAKITKKDIIRLFIQMQKSGDLTPYEFEYKNEYEY